MQFQGENRAIPLQKWNNTYGSTVATDRTTGLNGYQWPNLPTIIGYTWPQANPHFSSIWVITLIQAGKSKDQKEIHHQWTHS